MNMQNVASRVRLSLLTLGLLAAAFHASAATLTWTNAAGNLQWSTAANWSPNAAPTANDTLRFGNAGGLTNAAGAVNNVVAASVTVSNLSYEAITANGYHTTLINPGVTLTVDSISGVTDEGVLTVGGILGTNREVRATIHGTNAALVVGNPGAPAANFSMAVVVVSSNTAAADSSHRAILDLSGLDNFTYGGGVLLVGSGGASGGQGVTNNPAGTLLLARTNLIIASRSSPSTLGAIRISYNNAGNATGQSENLIELGQENTIRTEYLRIGGMKALNGGAIRFRAGLNNPTLRLRHTDDFSRMTLLTLGDNNEVTTGVTSTGVMDLSGGTVDALVTTMFVGRSYDLNSNSSRNGNGTGTLSFTGGTIDATTVNLGSQVQNNNGLVTGVMNVRTNAKLFVNALNIGRTVGIGFNGTGAGNGTLNVLYGGQVTVTNNISENSSLSVGSSTINLTNGTLNVGGRVRVDNLNIINGSALGLLVSPTVTVANPSCNVTNLILGTPATFNIVGDSIALAKYPLIKYMGSIGGSGFPAATLGTLPTGVSGYLSNDTVNSFIVLVVTNIPATRWNGTVVGGDWDINTTVNWLDAFTSAPTTYKENTIPGDSVLFSDSAAGTKTVNLTTTLNPTKVTVDNAGTYTFMGTGGITGSADLYKGGSGTLEVSNAGANDYAGGTLVVGGTLRVNSSITGVGTMSVLAGATLSGTGTVSSPITIGAAGMLAAGNSIGTLTFNNLVTLSTGSSNIFEVNSDTLEHDQIAGFGLVTAGGTLVVNCTGSGTALTNGAEVQLFTTAMTGSFGAFQITPAAPGYDLYWDTSTVAVDGKIRVLTIPAHPYLVWTNSSGNLLWSDPANWIRINPIYPGSSASNSVPTFEDTVLFGNALGLTNASGMVNNIVDSSQTVSNYTFEAVANNGYHTTLIQSGQTLTIDSSHLTGNEGNFNFQRAVGQNQQMYATIRGTNANLTIGIPSVTNISFGFSVYATSTNVDPAVSSHRATLDMSGLDNFNFWGAFILVAGSGSAGEGDQPSGRLLLAKTNIIVAGRHITGSGSSGAGSIRIANCLSGNGTGQSENLIELGQENTLCGNYLRIGGAQSVNGGAIRFRTGLTSPTLIIRAPDQVNRMQYLTMGDNNATITTNSANGVMDLSGGVVDLMVDELHVGRSYTTADATRNGSGKGTLMFSGGTVDATTLNIGSQTANNLASSTGIVHVANSGLLIAANINIGGDAGTRTGTGFGTLNLSGGTVSVSGNITENNAGGGNGSSTINLTNGFVSVAGTITVDDVNAISGVISNTGLMTVGTLRGAGTVAGSATVTGSLSPGNSIGTLTNYGDLILSGSSTNVFEVNIDTLAHDFVTGMNSVTYGGTLVVLPAGGLGTAITNGASAKLFHATSYNGSFAAILPTTPGAGLAWDTSDLTVNGTLKITTGVSTTPTNLLFAVVGNTLDISWPASHTGWRLQAQTNSINIGISNNWFTVAGSTTTNHVIMPLNPANGAVFYRLIYP